MERSWTEAPASWNIRYRINGFDEQITLRGETYSELTDTIDKARVYVGKLIGAAPATKSAADAVNVEPPAAPAPASSAQSGNTVQTIHAVKLQIEPRPDGKVNLNFFEAGHNYADIKATKTPAEAVALLQPIGGWELAHMVASEYVINAVIDWKPSANLNKNGKPYKNIVTIAQAQP